jgi:predicted kinase
MVAYGVAADNLRIGLSVVADTVNPWPQTRAAWREVATAAGAPLVEIEVICSDPQSTGRVEGGNPTSKASGSRPGMTWAGTTGRDREHVAVDTAGQSVEQSFAALLQSLHLD